MEKEAKGNFLRSLKERYLNVELKKKKGGKGTRLMRRRKGYRTIAGASRKKKDPSNLSYEREGTCQNDHHRKSEEE